MMRPFHITVCIFILSALCATSFGIERFPPPDFTETGHKLPVTTTPPPRTQIYEYIDVAVLISSLGLASYFTLRKRSRKSIFILMLFSLAYFGFWRKGCVCPIGGIQNVTLAIFDGGYALPISVLLFFLAPLIFTIFFGRTFCAAVCPLGAIQDIVILKPLSLPQWLSSALRLLAYAYLAFAVLFAATGSAFIICRYDPFVSFFRLSGDLNILVIGACLLIIGIFVARPYCRFLCPYAVILRPLSRLSKWHVTITPDECINCRLCEDTCPFDAIEKPTVAWPAGEFNKGRKRLAFLLVLLPLLVLSGGWTLSAASRSLSRVHPTIRLANRLYLEETGRLKKTTDASVAFRATGKQLNDLYAEALNIQSKFDIGSWFVGGFLGLAFGLELIKLSIKRTRTDYEPNKAECLACGRCFEYCPKEQVKLKPAE